MYEPSERVRFNWGFHDATMDGEQGWLNRSRLTDRCGTSYPLPQGKAYASYRAGYLAGWESFKALGYREETSERAWKERKAVKVE